MQSARRIGYHESTIVSVRQVDGSIDFVLEDVQVDDSLHTVSIRAAGIKRVLFDGNAIEDFTGRCEGGEILTLNLTDRDLYLIVELTDFKTQLAETHSCQITCESILIDVD